MADQTRHPNATDHQQIEQWMRKHFGPGLIGFRSSDDGACHQYQAQRRRPTSLTVSYTLEITQEAFDRQSVEAILESLESQQVAQRLLADPLTHLRYLEGGQIVPSPQ